MRTLATSKIAIGVFAADYLCSHPFTHKREEKVKKRIISKLYIKTKNSRVLSQVLEAKGVAKVPHSRDIDTQPPTE